MVNGLSQGDINILHEVIRYNAKSADLYGNDDWDFLNAIDKHLVRITSTSSVEP